MERRGESSRHIPDRQGEEPEKTPLPPVIDELIENYVIKPGISFGHNPDFESALAAEREQWRNDARMLMDFGESTDEIVKRFEARLHTPKT